MVVYLKVDRKANGNSVEYKVGRYGGTDSEPELWRLNDIDGMPILEYYPRKEMMDATFKLMYAFNRNCADVYECIIAQKNPSFSGLDHSGSCKEAGCGGLYASSEAVR